jgi:hypothetical protein
MEARLKARGMCIQKWRQQDFGPRRVIWPYMPSEFSVSLSGARNPVISQELTREMLRAQKEGVGLGLFLDRSGKNLRFKHAGRDEGFDALFVAYAEQRLGAVLMINSNDDSGALERIVELIAREYQWPNYP